MRGFFQTWLFHRQPQFTLKAVITFSTMLRMIIRESFFIIALSWKVFSLSKPFSSFYSPLNILQKSELPYMDVSDKHSSEVLVFSKELVISEAGQDKKRDAAMQGMVNIQSFVYKIYIGFTWSRDIICPIPTRHDPAWNRRDSGKCGTKIFK